MSIYYGYKEAPEKCSRCECFKGRYKDGEWKFACSVGVCVQVKKKREEEKKDDVLDVGSD